MNQRIYPLGPAEFDLNKVTYVSELSSTTHASNNHMQTVSCSVGVAGLTEPVIVHLGQLEGYRMSQVTSDQYDAIKGLRSAFIHAWGDQS